MAETEEPRAGADLDLVGHLLDGRYRILSLVGRGGMSTVFLADDERMSRKVCVKVPHPSYLAEPGFRERFTREVQSLTRMEHPHVVKVHDTGEYRGLPYAVLQYLAGGSLRGRFAWHGGRVPPDDVPKWLPAVAGALEYLHEHGLVHRDVKPTNILFDEQGNVFVADFGIAKALGERETGLTQTGQTPGSPEYMAPEVVTGGPLGPSYDQYALGVVVYQALAGRFPFEGTTPLQVLVRKRTDRPIPLGRFAPEVPPGVAAAVMRAIDRDPARRFPSCGAFALAYERGLAAATTAGATAGEAARAAGPGAAAGKAPRRGPIAAAAAAVVLLLAAGLLAWRPWEGPARAAGFGVVLEDPADGTWSRSRDVVVRGRVRGSAPREVVVGAVGVEGARTPGPVRAPVVDGAFAATLSFPADGRWPLYVEDADGAPRWRVEVGVDATPPAIEDVAPPAERTTVAAATATVVGRALDANLLEVRREGVGPVPAPEGAFAVEVAVTPDAWTEVTLVAVDRAGNESARVVRAFRRGPPAPPWSAAAARAAEAVAAKRWDDAGKAVAEMTAAGAPEGAVPADVARALEAWGLVQRASARLAAGDRREAGDLLTEARRRGLADADVPEALRPLLAAPAAGVRVAWAEPFEGARLVDAEVVVRGRLAGGDGVDAVTVNGLPAALERGAFSARVPAAKPGPLELVVVASKGGAPVGEARRLVERVAAPDAWRAALGGWAAPLGPEADAATGLPARVRRLRDGGEMRLVPAGTFEMGAVPGDSGATAAERPRRRVTLSRPYWLDVTEVTNAQFEAFVADTGRRTTAEVAGSAVTLRADGTGLEEVAGVTWRTPYAGLAPAAFPTRPVVQASWEDAAAFAAWAGAALPTEAQFERAARAGEEGRVFPWGAGAPPKGAGNFLGSEFKKAHPATPFLPIAGYEDLHVATAPVGTFGSNAYGLSDLVGNVWEWCADWFSRDGYPAGDATDPRGPESGTQRVLRGGSWFDGTEALRLSARASGAPTSCFVYRGFRCARTP
jgi:formylglycine-generating enzyme required for sulfatase activity